MGNHLKRTSRLARITRLARLTRSAHLVIFFAALSIVPTKILCCTSAFAQTVGNGTVFVPPAGAREAYGINAPQENPITYPTRHSLGGNGSGIGTSFIGTTSPTSESSPATTRPSFVADTTVQFHLPKLDSTFASQSTTPALQTFSPALPRLPGLGINSSPWADPLIKPNSFQPLEELPSFSKKPSVTDWMRF